MSVIVGFIICVILTGYAIGVNALVIAVAIALIASVILNSCMWCIRGYVFPLENADVAVDLAYGWHTNERIGASAFHDGVDLEAESGANVLAVADSTVLSAEFDAGSGYSLTLAHADGLQTFYAHLSEFLVAPGDAVQQGQIVAKTGERLSNRPAPPPRHKSQQQIHRSAANHRQLNTAKAPLHLQRRSAFISYTRTRNRRC